MDMTLNSGSQLLCLYFFFGSVSAFSDSKVFFVARSYKPCVFYLLPFRSSLHKPDHGSGWLFGTFFELAQLVRLGTFFFQVVLPCTYMHPHLAFPRPDHKPFSLAQEFPVILHAPLVQSFYHLITLSSVDPGLSLPERLNELARWETTWMELDLRKPDAGIDAPVPAKSGQPVEFSFGRYFIVIREGFGISAGYSFLNMYSRSSQHTNTCQHPSLVVVPLVGWITR